MSFYFRIYRMSFLLTFPPLLFNTILSWYHFHLRLLRSNLSTRYFNQIPCIFSRFILCSSIPNSMTMLPYSFRYANISAPSNIYFFFLLFPVLYCIALNIFILYQRISLPFLFFKRLTSINSIFENQFNSKETISLVG